MFYFVHSLSKLWVITGRHRDRMDRLRGEQGTEVKSFECFLCPFLCLEALEKAVLCFGVYERERECVCHG